MFSTQRLIMIRNVESYKCRLRLWNSISTHIYQRNMD